MSFKLIAIRPLKKCDKRFVKNLSPGEIYTFYNDYQFIEFKQDELRVIKYIPTLPDDFFYVDRSKRVFNEDKNIPIQINVSAIVGKNGSGKSAITELFIAALFVISNKFDFIKKDEFLDVDDTDEFERRRYDKDLPNLLRKVAAEIYYSSGNYMYKLKIERNEIKYQKAHLKKNNFEFTNQYFSVDSKFDLPDFFYSMVVNYSLYAFNSHQMGMWIKAFFHKNDGYQMPIVINPYRDKGNIDINTRMYLHGLGYYQIYCQFKIIIILMINLL